MFIDCPVINIMAKVTDTAAGIPIATQITTLNLKKRNNTIKTNINPPKPFLSSKLILSLIFCDDKSYILTFMLLDISSLNFLTVFSKILVLSKTSLPKDLNIFKVIALSPLLKP